MRSITISSVAFSYFALCIFAVAQNPVPHRLESIAVLPDRTVSIRVDGRAPSSLRAYFDVFLLEVSGNLIEWQPLVTLVQTNSSTNRLTYVDSIAGGFNERFYRTFTNHLVTPLAKPSGPFAVGKVHRLVTDSSRTNRYGIRTNSSFMLTIWYPARASSGVLFDRYVNEKLARFLPSYWDEPNNVARMHAFSRVGAPIATNETSYPVVLYSHGYGGHREQNSEKAEELASNGFIVAAMDHGDCFASVFPNDQVVVGKPGEYTEDEARRTLPGRVRDVRFVVDELERLNVLDPFFVGRIDLGKLGGLGFSAGVGTIGEAARIDPRFQAVVLLNGYLQGAVELRAVGLPKPVLSMYQAGDSELLLFTKAIADAYWCQVRNTEHISFRDLVRVEMATRVSRTSASAIRASMLSFFNKHLKGNDDQLLDNPTSRFPVIFNFRKK